MCTLEFFASPAGSQSLHQRHCLGGGGAPWRGAVHTVQSGLAPQALALASTAAAHAAPGLPASAVREINHDPFVGLVMVCVCGGGGGGGDACVCGWCVWVVGGHMYKGGGGGGVSVWLGVCDACVYEW